MKSDSKRYVSLIIAAVLVFIMLAGSCGGSVTADAAVRTGKASIATDTDAGQISGLQAVPNSSSSIQLTWDVSEGVDAYRVYVYDVTKKIYKEMGNTDAGEFLLRGLAKSGNEYQLAVRGYVYSGDNLVEATELTCLSAKTFPKAPKLSELGSHSISCTYTKWNAVTGADGYQVYRYNSSTKQWSMLTDTTKLIYKDTGRSAATGYIYRVRAYMTYNGQTYYSAYSNNQKTATVPRSVSEAVYYENQIVVKRGHGEYSLAKADAPYMYVHGYKLELTKTNGCTGCAVYYQDVRSRSQASAKKAKLLGYTRSSVLNLRRTTRKGYERVFWVSTYYVYGGKRYVNPSRIPVTYEGVRYTYKDKRGKVTGIEEHEYGAVDSQLSEIRYYTSGSRLRKYDIYLYNHNGFAYGVRTYNAAGRLVKTERWR